MSVWRNPKKVIRVAIGDFVSRVEQTDDYISPEATRAINQYHTLPGLLCVRRGDKTRK